MSEVQICNIGLSFINVPAITALTDNSKAGRECNLNYEPKRDDLLRLYEWKFATTRVSLAPTTTTPAYEWTYEMNLPADCIKLLHVGDVDGYQRVYSLENNKILTNETILYIKYTKRITETSTMDPLFRAALSMYLAQHLANPLGMKSEYKKALDEYEAKISDARFAGSIEDYDEVMEATDWIESRF